MNIVEALILGIVQGLTEFLPVSSSGHLELGKTLLNTDLHENIQFSIAVHGATVLSTIVVFRKELLRLSKDFFSINRNEGSQYVWKLLFSMIPVGLLGVFFSDEIESWFFGNPKMVGGMLILTSIVLALTRLAPAGKRQISFQSAFIIGIAQALAVIPGISRSGLTISTGLYMGHKKGDITQFSFLMVILPILGANMLEIFKGGFTMNEDISLMALITGFASAFIAGLFACKWMLTIVRKGNIYYFALYCLIIGILALVLL